MLSGRHAGCSIMFNILFLATPESDQPVEVVNFPGNRLADAIDRAKSLIANTQMAGLMHQPGRPPVIGFRILDNGGAEVHREYLPGA
jgi:hypothetical protein